MIISGYDHMLLIDDSRTFLDIRVENFALKTSPFVYHTGLVVSHYFRSKRIPFSLYIDDRHVGQLQVSPSRGPIYCFQLENDDSRNFPFALFFSSHVIW